MRSADLPRPRALCCGRCQGRCDGYGFTGIDDAVVQPIVTVNGTQAAVGYWGLTEDSRRHARRRTVDRGCEH